MRSTISSSWARSSLISASASSTLIDRRFVMGPALCKIMSDGSFNLSLQFVVVMGDKQVYNTVIRGGLKLKGASPSPAAKKSGGSTSSSSSLSSLSCVFRKHSF